MPDPSVPFRDFIDRQTEHGRHIRALETGVHPIRLDPEEDFGPWWPLDFPFSGDLGNGATSGNNYNAYWRLIGGAVHFRGTIGELSQTQIDAWPVGEARLLGGGWQLPSRARPAEDTMLLAVISNRGTLPAGVRMSMRVEVQASGQVRVWRDVAQAIGWDISGCSYPLG